MFPSYGKFLVEPAQKAYTASKYGANPVDVGARSFANAVLSAGTGMYTDPDIISILTSGDTHLKDSIRSSPVYQKHKRQCSSTFRSGVLANAADKHIRDREQVRKLLVQAYTTRDEKHARRS